jgi:transposase
VICVETIGKIRRWHRVDKLSISKIARRLSASRNTIAKYLEGEVTQPRYKTRAKRAPVMGAWVVKLQAMLAEDAERPRKEQRTAQRLHDGLVQEGFTGSYPTVQRFVKAWREERRHGVGSVFIPQSFAPGEAYQFDWSYEMVDLGGRPTPVKVAHLRLCHSRVFLAVAYLREAQEMVFDAHWRAFSLWGGSCRRGIYDNLKTAVELIFSGKARQYNRKFLQMASHYLIEPVACTPGAGWEKGQIENQVGHVRENIFTPRLRCKDLTELNALLARRCVQMAQATPHPEQRERTRWEVFEASERALLVPLAAKFEGCIEREVRVSSSSLVHVDRNRYSVDCRYAGKTVSLRTYADRIVAMAGGQIVGEHGRSFERDRTFFDPWHYVAALEKKPGALRNGAPFKDWALPPALREMKDRLCAKAGGDRQFVTILATIAEDGIEAVTVACELALEASAISDSYVLNALNRFKPQPPAEVVVAPKRLQLKVEPTADVGRYDVLLKKLAVAAIAALPMLLAAASHRGVEVPYGTS